MNRIALTDRSGRWFDLDSATSFTEATTWDGNNHVSVNGGNFSHERLHRTAGGRWIVNHWSQWQGSAESYEEISDSEAAAWLVLNEHEPHEACAAEFLALEVA